MSRATALVGLAAVVVTVACGANASSNPGARAEPTTVWHQLGTWSGRSSAQTASFRSDTGTLRVRWETKVPADVAAKTSTFRLTAHSAISGRLLQQVLEHGAVGSGTEYVQQDPNTFYLVVDASQIEWTVTVDEGIAYP